MRQGYGAGCSKTCLFYFYPLRLMPSLLSWGNHFSPQAPELKISWSFGCPFSYPLPRESPSSSYLASAYSAALAQAFYFVHSAQCWFLLPDLLCVTTALFSASHFFSAKFIHIPAFSSSPLGSPHSLLLSLPWWWLLLSRVLVKTMESERSAPSVLYVIPVWLWLSYIISLPLIFLLGKMR